MHRVKAIPIKKNTVTTTTQTPKNPQNPHNLISLISPLRLKYLSKTIIFFLSISEFFSPPGPNFPFSISFPISLHALLNGAAGKL